MKISYIVILGCLSLFIYACASTGSGKINKPDNCKVPRFDWMEIVEGYDKKEVFELATKFEAAAKVDAEKVKLFKDASSEISLTASLQQIINNTTGRKVMVSQEFFQNANSYRTTVCNIERWLKDGTLSEPTVRIEAQRQLLSSSSSFNSIAADLRRKIEELDKRVTQTENAIKPVPLPIRLRQLLSTIDPKILPSLKEGNTNFNGGLTSTQFNDLQKIAKELGADKYITISPDVNVGIGFGPEGVTYGVKFTLNPSLITD